MLIGSGLEQYRCQDRSIDRVVDEDTAQAMQQKPDGAHRCLRCRQRASGRQHLCVHLSTYLARNTSASSHLSSGNPDSI